MSASTVSDSTYHKFATVLAYSAVALLIVIGWTYADLNWFNAEQGWGYWFGIIGTTLMALLLLYPLRKRARFLRNAGPVRYWFRLHMIFGIVGPLFIIFHSNFDLGSLNSRLALFFTLIVSASGIIGRYIYAQLHYGLYGKQATLIGLRKDISELRTNKNGLAKLMPTINKELNAVEDTVFADQQGALMSFLQATQLRLKAPFMRRRLWQASKKIIDQSLMEADLKVAHRKRLRRITKQYLRERITLLCKFAQFKTYERLFSLWHIVHYPLFILLILAVTVHIVAVHMY